MGPISRDAQAAMGRGLSEAPKWAAAEDEQRRLLSSWTETFTPSA